MKLDSLVLVGATLILVGGLGSLVYPQASLPPEVVHFADVVFYNGKVLTADDQFTIAQAVAIRDEKFLAVGESGRILQMAGPQTRKIDLHGKTLIPGFIASHAHGWIGNIATGTSRSPGQSSRPGWEPAYVGDTEEGYLEYIKTLVAKYPPGEWIRTSTIRNDVTITQLNRWKLDTVSPENPVLLKISPSESVLNSLALEEMFQTGIINSNSIGVQKDDQGRPNGQLWGLAEGEIGLSFTPWPEEWDTTWVELQKEQLQDNVKHGVTSRSGRAQGLAIAILNEIYQAGELPLRVRITHEFYRKNANYLVQLRRFGNLSGVGDDWFRIIGTGPQQVDGGSEIGAIFRTRGKIRRMANEAYGTYGKSYWHDYPPGYVENTVIELARHGWNVTGLHNYGDASSELVTKAYEKAAAAKPFKRRWTLDHNWEHTPETMERMKKLNIVPSVLLWFVGRTGDLETEADRIVAESFGGVEEPMIYMYGPDALASFSLGRTWIDQGFKPIAESGARDVLTRVEGFITRKGQKGRVWNPEERVSRQEALWMITNWAAYYAMDEDKLGTIEAGKLADLVVLGQDYMTVAEDEISDIPILMTMVGGRVVHEVPNQF